LKELANAMKAAENLIKEKRKKLERTRRAVEAEREELQN
jgi:hypothetical protein